MSEKLSQDLDLAKTHKTLALSHLGRQQSAEAMLHSAAALKLAPNAPDIVVTRAVVLIRENQPNDAWQLLASLVAQGLPDRNLASAFAWVSAQIGFEAQAVAVIERALQDPGLAPVAQRKLHVDAMTLLERTGHYDQAFAHMQSANDLAGGSFDPQAYSSQVCAWISYFTPLKMQSLPRATHGNCRPIFIIGMPRSGTSLIEQILASHPAVFGGGELSLMGDVVNSLAAAAWADGIAYPQCVDRLTADQADRLGGKYVAEINRLNDAARYVTDKMPQNFEFLGLIELLLPQCRIIHCRRDPRDTCLSCFLTDFDAGNTFSLKLSHLASFYRGYRQLMKHWKSVSSLAMLEVCYEAVVSDLPGQTRRMLEFLELPWDERCLAFHNNKRDVATASRDQVRRPIYGSSIGRWKQYERQIPELLQLAEEEDSGT